MIYWLVQSTSDHPDLARGVAPVGLLSDSEQDRLAALKIDKRRRDWLLGRWTAKRLIQSYVERQTGLRLPLDAIAIEAEPSGAPRVEFRNQRLAIGDWPVLPQSSIANLQSLSLSISHSGDRAFCALVQNGSIGADIERIESRDWQFVEDYFTADEVLQVRQAPAEQYETVVTAIWSAKEAALKALRLGLTVDIRSVSCLFPALEMVNDWIAFDIIYDRHLLELADIPWLAGRWRRRGDFVLTVAGVWNRRRGLEIDDPTNRAVMLNEVKHLTVER